MNNNEFITINNRDYKAKEFDFNFLCMLGENNIEVGEIGKKVIPSLRCYIAYCMGTDVETAGEEFNKHVIANGGGFEEIMEVFSAKAEESDFFRALTKTETQETTTATPKKNTRKEKVQSE